MCAQVRLGRGARPSPVCARWRRHSHGSSGRRSSSNGYVAEFVPPITVVPGRHRNLLCMVPPLAIANPEQHAADRLEWAVRSILRAT
jgi:hypothetical protein